MDIKYLVRFAVYMCSFIVAMIGMNSLNYEKFIRKNRVWQAQLLFFLIAISLAYLVGNFFLEISNS